jgi:tetratricopeptide (TPR) repeat protein
VGRRHPFSSAWIAGAAAIGAVVSLGLKDADLPPPERTWIRVETPNFTILSGASERRTLEIARRLERFREVLSRFYRDLKVNSPLPTFVYIFRDDASFTPYKTRFEGRPVDLAGSFVAARDANYVAINGASESDPLSTIYHEYIHYFANNNLPRLPTWFGEGLAECYDTFRADEKVAQIGRPVHGHIQTLRSSSLIPLRELFAITARSRDYNEGDRRGIFYAQSWALTHYLLWGNPERKPQLVQFLDRLRQGIGTDEAFTASFQTTPEKLQAELRSYVSQGRFLFSVVKFDELRYDASARVTPMSREDVLCRLGDYLARTAPDRAADAEKHFLEALKVNPGHAASHAGLGVVLDLSGRPEQSAAHFEKALALDPNDALAAYRYAESLLFRQDPGPEGVSPDGVPAHIARARELFGQSIAARPGFAEAYVGYGLTFFRTPGSVAPGITMLEKAARLLPSRTDILRNLTVLYAEDGRWDEAHAIVERVLTRMNDPESLESARTALAQMESRRRPAAPASPPGETVTDAPGEPTGSTEELPSPGKGRGGLDRADEHQRQVAVYNRAVELANRRDYTAAIALLEKLLGQIKDPDLAAQTRALLAQFRKDAARRPRRAP